MQPRFQVGDKAVYPAQGVAEIVGIESKEIAGNQEIFYVLRVMDADKRIMIPVSKVTSVGLREIIGAQEVEQVYAVLRLRDVKIDHTTWNRRYRRYLEKIKTGLVIDVAEVLRDLYILKQEKPLSFGERKMLDTARALLIKELAVAQKISEDEVLAVIFDIFGEDPNANAVALEEEEEEVED